MKMIITTPEQDPLGSMMLDYLNGDEDACVTVESATLDMWEMTGQTMFRTFGQMNRIERKALSLCKGHVLDIGAGSGCHSLYLQEKGFRIDSLDQSCGCIEVMRKRGVKNPIHDNLFSLKNRQYDTLLMLMNGIGITGSLDGLNLFFQFAAELLTPQGQIITDSTDLSQLYDVDSLVMEEEHYYGETEFIMVYKQTTSDPFEWLYVDFENLSFYAEIHGFECNKIMDDSTGKYLVQIRNKT